MSKSYRYVVTETYPNGETWSHYYMNRQDADWGMEDLIAAHRGRTYKLTKVTAA